MYTIPNEIIRNSYRTSSEFLSVRFVGVETVCEAKLLKVCTFNERPEWTVRIAHRVLLHFFFCVVFFQSEDRAQFTIKLMSTKESPIHKTKIVFFFFSFVYNSSRAVYGHEVWADVDDVVWTNILNINILLFPFYFLPFGTLYRASCHIISHNSLSATDRKVFASYTTHNVMYISTLYIDSIMHCGRFVIIKICRHTVVAVRHRPYCLHWGVAIKHKHSDQPHTCKGSSLVSFECRTAGFHVYQRTKSFHMIETYIVWPLQSCSHRK